jgi:S1-C subfamily serine protease
MSDRDATGYGTASGEGDDEDTPGIPPEDDLGRPLDALPHPLDRLWVHPSELAAVPVTAPAAPSRARPMWAATVMAGAAGAILTVGVLGAVGALDRPAAKTSAGTVVPTSTPVSTAEAVVLAVAHSVVAVSAHDGRVTRRGSGVCVRRSGEILTSDRLIGKADRVKVTTADGQVHTARVVGRDRTTDLLLLRLVSEAGARAEPLVLARSATFATSAAQAGDAVWVVGAPSPGGSSPWLSNGLVASTDSIVAVESGPTTSGLLETGAASNAASSGGALVDKAGKVTGIVLAPVGGKRMTYAVPIDTALSIADDLREQGFTAHGALAIDGTNTPDGPMVTSTDPEGPAALAGIRVGDIIESVDHHQVDTMSDVMALVRHDRPGESIVLGLRRGAAKLTTMARLTSLVTP